MESDLAAEQPQLFRKLHKNKNKNWLSNLRNNELPEASMDFSIYDQLYILDIFAQQTAHQWLCVDYLNLSTVPSISAAFQTNAI